jgi:hypothetical protein
MNSILLVGLFFSIEVASVDPNSACSTDTATSKSGAEDIKHFSSSILFFKWELEHFYLVTITGLTLPYLN